MLNYLIKNSQQVKNRTNRGRPTVEIKKQFRNVAVPLETHPKIKALAEAEGRTIAKQLQLLIDNGYEQKFGLLGN